MIATRLKVRLLTARRNKKENIMVFTFLSFYWKIMIFFYIIILELQYFASTYATT